MNVSNAPRACLIWLCLLLTVVGYTIWDGSNCELRTDGPLIALDSNATMRQQFDNDTITTLLSKGDSVQVLGIDRSSYGQKWLMKTRQGNIGWIDASDLTGIRQIVTDGSDKGDTVSVSAVWLGAHIHKYAYTNKNGEKRERSTYDFMPAEDWADDFYYDRTPVAGVCTQQKFEKNCIGRNFNEISSEFSDPVLVRITPSGFEALYSWKTFDSATGQMSKPTVSFAKDSVATAVSFGRATNRAAGWLKKMPLASSIIDCPLTSLMVRGSHYIMDNPMPSTGMKVFIYCMIPVYLLILGLWMFALQAVPTLLMGWLMTFPRVFAILNDGWLRALIFIVALVSCYVWIVTMMAWGMFPFWSLIIAIISWYAFAMATSPLCTYPHCRCPKCHHMYTIQFDYEKFEYDEIKTGEDIVKGQRLGKRTESWKTWTRVTTTTTYGDGHKETSSYNTNEKTHHRDYNTYQFIDYKVTYRLDHYRQYHKCSCCGHVEETTSVAYTELKRERIGSHVAEIAGDEY